MRYATMSSIAGAALAAVISTAALAAPPVADCGPDKLGTARTITLARDGALYGAHQHAPLPLQKGEVVLTFDDGPVAGTEQVLMALAAQCARATFLMTGEHLEQSPALARRVVAAGHTAGLHSHVHPHLSQLSAAQQLDDLAKAQAAYQSVFGVQTPAYRFPYLEEAPATLAALKAQNITVLSIDLGILDWQPEDTTAILAARLRESLDKSGGGILLMHDANGPTVAALPTLLQVIKEKGYKVVHLEWAAP